MDMRQALSCIDSGKYELALTILDQTTAADRDRGIAAYFRAIAHRAVADGRSAAADYARARGLTPTALAPDLKDMMQWHSKDAIGLFNRGCAFHNEQDLDRAINNYSAALKLEAERAAALLNRGLAFQARDRNNPASGTYDERHGGVPDCYRAEDDFVAVLRLRAGARLHAIARCRLAGLREAC